MRKLIRQLIREDIQKKMILQEMDISLSQDVIQTLWNLISAGIISWQLGKSLMNAYKSGKKTEEDINKIVKFATVDFLDNRRRKDDDTEFDDIEITQFPRSLDSSGTQPMGSDKTIPRHKAMPGHKTSKLEKDTLPIVYDFDKPEDDIDTELYDTALFPEDDDTELK